MKIKEFILSKKKRILVLASSAVAVTGVVILLVVLLGAGRDIEMTVYNPLGEIEPLANQPLAARLSTLNGADIALVYYAQPQNPHAVRAVGEMLESEFGITARLFNIGSSIGAKPLSSYEALAGYDAVVLGVADCTLSAWWASYHAKMIESYGTPVVVLTHAAFEKTLEVGAMDNGFTGVRKAVIDPGLYSAGFLQMTATSNTNFLRNTAFVTTTETMPVSVYDQVKTALTAPLTGDESNPPEITARQLAGWTAEGAPDPTAQMLTVSGVDEVAVSRNFDKMAMELGFGDGLPLILPLPELVEEMLAATTRDPGDILGRVMPRGGIITVEKVAVNSVMAGARPEYFPVILAAMEAYATSWEDGNLLYHSLTSSDNYTMMLLISGPIVEELGISGEWGYLGSGNEANNAIGRAVRLSIRNIGQNRTHETDGTARVGRQNDHAMTVFGEEAYLLPDGWERHSELMGFDAGQSTVTLLGYAAPTMYEGAGGANAAWHPRDVLQTLRNRVPAANQTVMITTIPRSIADMARIELGLESKAELLEYMMNMGITAGFMTPANPGARIPSEYLVWPVVVGDPDSAQAYRATNDFYGAQAFQTRLINGATITQAGRDPTTPGAPQNFTVTRNGTSATLTWTAPASDGGSPVTGYQVSFTAGSAAGALNPGGAIPVVTATIFNPAAASGSAIPAVPATLPAGSQPVVPAWTGVSGGQMTYTFEGLDAAAEYIFQVRAVNGVRNAVQVTGTGNTPAANNRILDYSASGRGACAVVRD